MTVQQNDIIEASARLEYSGNEDAVNVYQFQYEDAPPLEDGLVVDDVIEILEAIYFLMIAAISAATTFRDIRIRNVTQDLLMGTFGWPVLTTGENLDGELPYGVAAMISFPTDIPRVTMRKYFPKMTEGNLIANGTWDAPLQAMLAAVGASMLTPYVINLHTYQYGYLSPKTVAFEAPVAAVITDVPAYQRRRKPGRGS